MKPLFHVLALAFLAACGADAPLTPGGAGPTFTAGGEARIGVVFSEGG
ncbi:hypothetical protein BCF33_2519 [Hasllibacter halocynthiae]|uniref:Uncharacterized protein n=1 Tax=Hasllibacter halocynthiae TaxID=595589 RepID=A0A2T0X3W9_9RHOB|nr:hypothetical protein [Hasllibacter halocynthiae]PRY93638.1 hypothetical protein BCF33_2519 [Hasllibacter halocynthiae]